MPAFESGLIPKSALIDINVLEYLVVIVNYALCLIHFNQLQPRPEHYPSLLNHVDNMAAHAWAHKSTYKPRSRSMGHILGLLLLNSPLSLNTRHIEGVRNVIADAISRLHSHPSHSTAHLLTDVYPQGPPLPRSPAPPNLVSELFAIASSDSTPDLSTPLATQQKLLAMPTSSSGVQHTS